jgi:hypothetical protein
LSWVGLPRPVKRVGLERLAYWGHSPENTSVAGPVMNT